MQYTSASVLVCGEHTT